MRKGKHISEEEFVQIREALDKGVSQTVLSKLSGRSMTTINVLNKYEDYESYINRNKVQPMKGDIYPQLVEDAQEATAEDMLIEAAALLNAAMRKLRETVPPEDRSWYRRLKADKGW